MFFLIVFAFKLLAGNFSLLVQRKFDYSAAVASQGWNKLKGWQQMYIRTQCSSFLAHKYISEHTYLLVFIETRKSPCQMQVKKSIFSQILSHNLSKSQTWVTSNLVILSLNLSHKLSFETICFNPQMRLLASSTSETGMNASRY